MTDYQLNRYRAVIVTGGSSGIGEHFIATIGKLEGQRTIFNLSRTNPSGNDVEHIPCDLSAEGAIAQVFPQLEAALAAKAPDGPILLINNAGFGDYAAAADREPERLEAMVRLNVDSLVSLTLRMLPLLRQRGGGIIHVSSMLGFGPAPNMATYGATKAFVLSWGVALHEELKPHGIPVVTLCPGTTRTAFFDAAKMDAGRMLKTAQTPQAVVNAALRGLERGRSVVVPGARNKFMAATMGLLAPGTLARAIGKVMSQARGKPDTETAAGD